MAKNISYLDGFRGFSAFWVLAAHCAIWGGVNGVWIPNPKVAVDIFMVMSGFLMAFTALQRQSIEPLDRLSSWLRFYVRRFFRLAPAYYLALVVAILLAEPFLGGYAELRNMNPTHWGAGTDYNIETYAFTAENILAHVTFVFGLIPKYSSSTGLPDWSLGLEMQFYLVFPMIYLLMRRFGRVQVTLCLVLLTAATTLVLWKLPGSHGSLGPFPEPSFILLKLHLFLIGILLCDIFHGGLKHRQRDCSLALTVFLAIIQIRFYRADALLLVACVLMIILLESRISYFAPARKALVVMLGNSFTKFLAEMSYSVYLVHGFFLAILGAALFRLPEFSALSQGSRFGILLVIVTACSYLSAYLVDKFVEQPGIRLGKAVAQKIGLPAPFERSP